MTDPRTTETDSEPEAAPDPATNPESIPADHPDAPEPAQAEPAPEASEG